MTTLKGKLVTALLTLLMFMPVISVVANAQLDPNDLNVKAYVDKPWYKVGEEGTLHITLLNYRDEAIEVRNITIMYSWFNFVDGEWQGNTTIIPSDTEKALASNGGMLAKEDIFTVPDDGRAQMYNWVQIIVYTDRGIFQPPNTLISIASQPASTIADVDKIVTLLTVQIVLIVVCCLIIAAAVFMARPRSPFATPTKEA